MARAVLLVLDLTLCPLPMWLLFGHAEEPYVVEDVVGSAAAAENEEVICVEAELGLAVAGNRAGLGDITLGPTVGCGKKVI